MAGIFAFTDTYGMLACQRLEVEGYGRFAVMAEESNKSILKRMPRGSVGLMFAGDLILAKCDNPKHRGLFRRFEAIFETLANTEKDERLLRYKLLNALMLTSYAKKAESSEERRRLFDLKNNLFMSIAQDPQLRSKVQYKYLVSKNFRILKYCDACLESNKSLGDDKRLWKHCRDCSVDRNFFNVVAMSHRFPQGSACIFISHDEAKKLPALRLKLKGRLGEVKEEARFEKFQYNVKNLDSISLDSVLKMYDKLATP